MRNCLVLLFGIVFSSNQGLFANNRSSTINVSPDGHLIAAVNNDSRSVTLVALPSREILKEIIVDKDPQAIAFSPDGLRAFVTHRATDSVSVIDVNRQGVQAAFATVDEPGGVLVDSIGRLFIANQGSASVSVVNARSGETVAIIPTVAGPRGLAFSPDESRLYVTHFASGSLSIIDTSALEVLSKVSTGPDSNLSNGVVLNAEGTRAYLPQTRSDSTNPALVFDATVFPIVSVVDLESLTNLNPERIHLDLADEPVGMPFDAVLKDELKLYVLNAGSNDISVIDPGTGKGLAHIEAGHHPRGLALSADGNTLFVNNSLSGTVSVIDTETDTVVDEIEVTRVALTGALLNGKRLFNSSDRADLAREQWIACSICHFDGEMDERTWFFPDGPRNTTSLLGVKDTLPVHWSGDLDELQDVEQTIRGIQAGTGLAPGPDNCEPACDQAPPNTGRSRDLDDLAMFMETLDFPPNPNRKPDGGLVEAAERGKLLFHSPATGCSECHVPPLYTDGQRHDIGTAAESGERKGNEFDTPSLRGIYKTAPYLHDGSAATLRDVFTTANAENLHGTTTQLSDQDLDDLIAFLTSISGEDTGFEINAGLNDAWFEPATSGQGFFVTVYPNSRQLFLGWFTYDSERPASEGLAVLGDPGHRWLTAQGPYEGNRAVLEVTLTRGGEFDRGVPAPVRDSVGSLEVEFSSCNSGVLTYDLWGADLQGVIPIERIAHDNVSFCEALAQERRSQTVD
jgi:YVTN family beta-propeller protein